MVIHGLTLQMEKLQASADEEIGNVEKDQVYQGKDVQRRAGEAPSLLRAHNTPYSVSCFSHLVSTVTNSSWTQHLFASFIFRFSFSRRGLRNVSTVIFHKRRARHSIIGFRGHFLWMCAMPRLILPNNREQSPTESNAL